MSAIHWKTVSYNKLTLDELYSMLQLRSEIFVVEQNCVYQDIDGKDVNALHLLGILEGKLVAYARLFRPNDYFEQASIGRVVVKSDYRKMKLGHQLMKEAIDSIHHFFNEKNITISAQLYLKRFYEAHHFVQTSEMYLEDDIPHIEMKRIL